MKLLNFFLFLMFVGVFTSVSADDRAFEKQIKEMQDAPKEKRVVLMNELKIEMAQMSFFERSHVVDLLKKSRDTKLQRVMQTQQMIETRKQEQAQEIQAQTYAHLTQYQSYLQAVSQEVQTKLINPGTSPFPLNQ